MPVQQQSYRDLYAMMLATHPAMTQRAAEVPKRLAAMLHGTINQAGSHMASMHYVGASNGPLMSAMQQLKQTGLGDLFAADDRMARFGEFYLNALTPPEVRFGKVRKLIAVGDGSTEGTEAFGQLATALAGTKPRLAARLMDAWRQNGRVHSSFHGTTFVKIDEDLPDRPAVLGSATFDGYYSVLRNGWGTPDETAAWVINGEFYQDHRHDDRGAVVIYALGAPLALDWGSTYSPHVPGSFLHNMVVPVSSLKHPWGQDSPPLSGGSGWRGSRQEAFLAFGASAHAVSSFRQGEQITWTRSVTSIHPRADRPILVIRDSFAGPQAAAEKVATLCLAADGDAQTPAGKVTPAGRTHKGGPQGELPSAGEPFALPKGASRLQFTGQNWPAHPSKGIDWDLYVIADRDQQALIGNWAHCWHPGREASEFQRANGRAFEERQHILRVKGTGGFTMLLLPFRKGARPDAKVELDGDVVAIAAGADVLRIAPSWWSLRAEGQTILAALDAQAASAGEVSVKGGPAEVAVRKDHVRITLHGPAGVRKIKLPGAWRAAGPKDERVSIAQEGETWNVNLLSPGEPVTVDLTPAG
jgi:hypothetical protein